MFDIYLKIWALLNRQEKKKAILLLFLMIAMAFFEVLGIGSVMPFLSVLGNPDAVEKNEYLSLAYDFFNFKTTNSFLIFLGVFALLTLLFSAAVRSVASYAKFRFSNLRRHSIGQKLLKSYLRQPYNFFLSRNSSEVSKIILSEVDLTVNQSILPALNLLTYSILCFAFVSFLIAVDPFLAMMLASIFGSFYLLVYITIQGYIKDIGVKRSSANTKRFKITSETIGGIKDLKVLGREKVYLDSFARPSYEFSHYNSINATISEVPQFLVEVIAFGALLAMAIYALGNNSADVGDLLPILGLYALGAFKLKPAVNQIYKSVATMKYGASALNNVIGDLNRHDREMSLKNNFKRLHLQEKLRIDNVTFFYPNTENPAIKNINVEIQANTTIGIIGTTGAGKSTLVDIILGLLHPSTGSVVADTTKLTDENIRQWQNSIGYVPQSIFLADDTIASNIAFGVKKSCIDMAQVEKVAKMAQVHEFIIRQDKGYETIIGERGVRLSGGQRQRLGIARALYHDPELLVLDEATSALDNATEAEVMRAIDNMSGTKTIIMIAHRISTLERCDKIIRLENGELKEEKC